MGTSVSMVDISEVILQQAESLGMASSLRNLASRPEIASAGLDCDRLLQTLQACNGLVNKAKSVLLAMPNMSVSTPPNISTPSKEPSQEEAPADEVTPEKESKRQVDASLAGGEGEK